MGRAVVEASREPEAHWGEQTGSEGYRAGQTVAAPVVGPLVTAAPVEDRVEEREVKAAAAVGLVAGAMAAAVKEAVPAEEEGAGLACTGWQVAAVDEAESRQRRSAPTRR